MTIDPSANAAQAAAIIAAYYAAFNRQDTAAMLALLAEDVAHDINQGGREIGRDRFAVFLEMMNRHYREQLQDIVIMTEPGGTRAAAEFTVHGTYLVSADGLPPARGQGYVLPAAGLFALSGGKITRVTTYYNLEDWIGQVS